MAGEQGFEPRLPDPESGVLPLHHSPRGLIKLLFRKALGNFSSKIKKVKFHNIIYENKNDLFFERIKIKIMYRNFIKRFFDIILSLIALIIMAVPMLIFAFIIWREDGGPVFFLQKRVGIHKKHFMIYKFRTMKNSAPHETATHLFTNPNLYILKCGWWMRLYSIDELPQIINILKGDMSIVGPRPALWNQFDLIEERDKYGANDIKPGLTGWAQIQGRDDVGIQEKARQDGEYVKNESFIFDLMCVLKTFGRVLTHKNVTEGAKN